MAKLKLRFEWLPIVLAVLMLAGSSAEAKTDIFFAAIGPNNEFLDGGGSGYGDGKWHFYPNTAWWSEWFYSSPYTPRLKQLLDVSLTIEPLQADQPCLVQIAYSWTTSAWSQLGRNRPPLLAEEAKFIQRRMFFSSRFPSGSKPITFKKHLEIPYYNPQWVSIEVRGRNFLILDGSIDHRSAPRDAEDIARTYQLQAPADTGACCLDDGSCEELEEGACQRRGGTWKGLGTQCLGDGNRNGIDDACDEGPPPQMQACCFDDGSCADLTVQQCLNGGGTPQGPRATCATVTCPQPPPPPPPPLTGACCSNGDFWDCRQETEGTCEGWGGIFFGYGTLCSEVYCPVSGPEIVACCFDDGSCADLTEQQCLNSGGTPQGPGTTCQTTDCPQPPTPPTPTPPTPTPPTPTPPTPTPPTPTPPTPTPPTPTPPTPTPPTPTPPAQTQACCFANGSCDVLTVQQCLDRGGRPQGAGTNCTMVDCRVYMPVIGCLVAHWRLDEMTGTIAHDSAGQNDGTFEGNPQWVAGYYGGALEFDGDDWVNFGDILDISDAITIACWVNPAGLSGDNSWVARWDAYVFKSNGSSLRFTTPGILDYTADNTVLKSGQWQHVAVTFVPNQNGGAIFYLDGLEAQRMDSTAMNAVGGPFGIGNNQWSEFYEGMIDDVLVYNCALSEDEIQQLFRGEVASALVGHWKFDEGNGTVVTDSSGYRNDGTFEGNPQWVAGYYGGALEFDGDDWVNCGDVLEITDAITIACWVNPAGLSGDNSWVARWDAYVFKSSGSSLRFTTPGILDYTADNTVLKSGQWQHVAVTFVPNQTGGAIFYLNGVEAQRMDSTAMNAGGGPFGIGNNQWSEFYEGLIDDMRVYNCALSVEEIEALAQ